MPRNPQTVHVLRIALRGVQPEIWRRFAVRSRSRLSTLHQVIQVVMGWENYHLHNFVKDGQEYTPLDADAPREAKTDSVLLSTVLPEVGSRLVYTYDFGDDWEHDVVVESIERAGRKRYPRCLDGARCCPPEDVGGPHAYGEYLVALGDPSHQMHEQFVEWRGFYFFPEAFDVRDRNALLWETFSK